MLESNALQENDALDYWDYLTKHPHAIRKKLAIVYAGRSGSMLLSGLLDGHSHLLSFNYYCDATLYFSLKNFVSQGNFTVQTFKDFLNEKFLFILNAFYEHPLLPYELRQNKISIPALMSEIKMICYAITDSQLTLDLMLNIIFIAYGKILKRPLNTAQPILVIQIHTPFLMDGWKDLFQSLDKLDLIVMVRNPLKAIDSHFYHHVYEILSPPWHDFYARILLEYRKSFLPFFDKEMQVNSYCMFFEDIHTETEKTIQALCAHLHIPFEEVLLEETLQGGPAVFISAGKEMSGPSKAQAYNSSLRMIKKSDIYFIEFLFKDIIEELGYPLKSNLFQQWLSVFFLTKLERLFWRKEIAARMEHSEAAKHKKAPWIMIQLIRAYRKIKQKKLDLQTVFKIHRKMIDFRVKKSSSDKIKVIRSK